MTTVNGIKTGKRVTCGWCKRRNVNTTYNGALYTHTVPGTISTECKGYQTYQERGRSR